MIVVVVPPFEGDERLGGKAKRRGYNRPNDGLAREDRHNFGTRVRDQLMRRNVCPRRAKLFLFYIFCPFPSLS